MERSFGHDRLRWGGYCEMLNGDVRDCRIGMTLGYQTHAFSSAQQTPSSISPSVYGFDDFDLGFQLEILIRTVPTDVYILGY